MSCVSNEFIDYLNIYKGDEHAGIVQKALSDICTYLKTKGEKDKEVMISMVGFHDDRVIDLLNLD
jgi:hypothetical protein